MMYISRVALSLLITLCVLVRTPLIAKETPEEAAEQEKFRASIPLGGNFDPKPEEGLFVAAGHSMNIVISRDDGKTWKRVFYGRPCGDHGRWAVWNSVAYTKGVFAIASGWGAPGTILASEDGVNWRHLTDENRKPPRKGQHPYDMLTTMQMIGVNGSFIMPLEATPDFGKTWYRSSAYGFRDNNNQRIKINVAHPSLACGDHQQGKRVIVVGDEGPSLFSDDFGKTWVPLKVTVQPWEGRGAMGIIAKGNVFVIVKGSGETVLRSTDGGMTWKAHPLGVKRPASRSFCLSVVGDEFWVTGQTSKASKDGITWRNLPENTPSGRITVSDKGTLINVSRKRFTILRSTDAGKTWEEVYKFSPDKKAIGGAQGLSDVSFGYVKRLK